MQICVQCGDAKPEEDFGMNREYRRTVCNPCRARGDTLCEMYDNLTNPEKMSIMTPTTFWRMWRKFSVETVKTFMQISPRYDFKIGPTDKVFGDLLSGLVVAQQLFLSQIGGIKEREVQVQKLSNLAQKRVVRKACVALGLDPPRGKRKPTEAKVKRAYRIMSKSCHPDLFDNDLGKKQEFIELTKQFRILMKTFGDNDA